jgi:hypothetical protein
MQPTQSLPAHYAPYKTIDLTTDTRAMVILNIGALVLLVLAGWLLFELLEVLRPDIVSAGTFSISGLNFVLMALLVIGLLGLMIVVHEAIHGAFFWLYTRSRPYFGFKGMYAYAAAPEWYIPRNQYLVVGIMPLLLMTLAGLLLLPVAPAWLLLPVLFVVLMNASGAAGDVLVVGWLLLLPADTLIRDLGDAITLYRPQTESAEAAPGGSRAPTEHE